MTYCITQEKKFNLKSTYKAEQERRGKKKKVKGKSLSLGKWNLKKKGKLTPSGRVAAGGEAVTRRNPMRDGINAATRHRLILRIIPAGAGRRVRGDASCREPALQPEHKQSGSRRSGNSERGPQRARLGPAAIVAGAEANFGLSGSLGGGKIARPSGRRSHLRRTDVWQRNRSGMKQKKKGFENRSQTFNPDVKIPSRTRPGRKFRKDSENLGPVRKIRNYQVKVKSSRPEATSVHQPMQHSLSGARSPLAHMDRIRIIPKSSSVNANSFTELLQDGSIWIWKKFLVLTDGYSSLRVFAKKVAGALLIPRQLFKCRRGETPAVRKWTQLCPVWLPQLLNAGSPPSKAKSIASAGEIIRDGKESDQ